MSQELILSSNSNLEKYVSITGNFDYDTPKVRECLDMLSNIIEFNGKHLNKDEVVEFGVGILTDFVDAVKNTTVDTYLKFEAFKNGQMENYLTLSINAETMELTIDNFKVATTTDLSRSTIEAIFINKAGPVTIYNKLSAFINQ